MKIRIPCFSSRVLIYAGVASLATVLGACSGASSVTGPSPTEAIGVGVTALTFAKDVQPILAADCVSCHGPSRQENGVSLSTYAGVLRVASAGNSNSPLVRVTQPGGLMYSELSGNRTQKAQTIYDWVVSSNLAP